MPPHLHPRSTATSTLFAGTLFVSFAVVAIPHILPCPRPRRVGYQDSELVLNAEGKPIRRVRRPATNKTSTTDGSELEDSQTSLTTRARSLEDEAELFQQLKEEAEIAGKARSAKDRECPVPKPRTILQRMMGSNDTSVAD